MIYTIFLSSHILSEVEQIADHVGILDKGRLVDQFSMAEFRSSDQSHLLLETDLPEKAESLLRDHTIRFSRSGHQIKVYCPKAQNADIHKLMAANHIVVSDMSSIKHSLEDRFLLGGWRRQGIVRSFNMIKLIKNEFRKFGNSYINFCLFRSDVVPRFVYFSDLLFHRQLCLHMVCVYQ